jgi:hypothetical protein
MVDADIMAVLGETGIGEVGPGLAPVLQERGRVPLPPLGPKPAAFDAAQGQQDMGMWLRLAVSARAGA